jgi:hypothetical protein
MKILAISKDLPGGSDSRFTNELLRAEARKVWELNQMDVLREAYFSSDRTQAILILECAGVKEARAHLDELPLVKNSLIAFDVIPLVPYPGFARLFER